MGLSALLLTLLIGCADKPPDELLNPVRIIRSEAPELIPLVEPDWDRPPTYLFIQGVM